MAAAEGTHTHTVATSAAVSLSCVGGDFCRIYQERSHGDETLGVDFSAIKSGVGGAGGVGAWSLSLVTIAATGYLSIKLCLAISFLSDRRVKDAAEGLSSLLAV